MSDPGVWVPDLGWRVLGAGETKRCRQPSCSLPACAEMMRRSYARKKAYLYAYCEDHLYGRRLENNTILTQVASDSPAAERGYALSGPLIKS
jgi:hypothetical protein